jgi:peptidoglycan/LPS O-acetylase OafA/YrhL
MTQKRILIAMLLVMVLDGFVDATYGANGLDQPAAWSIPLTLCFSFLTFLWYRHDSDRAGYARSRGLNIAIILATPVSVPYYLLRSRPEGSKLRALLKCAGFAVLMVLCAAIGMLLTGHPLVDQ